MKSKFYKVFTNENGYGNGKYFYNREKAVEYAASEIRRLRDLFDDDDDYEVVHDADDLWMIMYDICGLGRGFMSVKVLEIEPE